MHTYLNGRRHLVPIHADNAHTRDWIVLLEANTIVGSPTHRLRVACTTQERKLVWRFKGLKPQLCLLIDGYDPRIHTLVLCPQLYRYDYNGTLIPMHGEEIGRFIAQALNEKSAIRCPWYRPADALSDVPIMTETILTEFDTLLVDATRPEPDIAPLPAIAGGAIEEEALEPGRID
jgi:hypothetical protein